MQQLLIACALLICLLAIYMAVVEGGTGLKLGLKRSHEATTEYVRGIDA